jgi:putative ATP-binding cassette transporter
MENKKENLFGSTYSNRRLLGGFWRLAKPYWSSEERWAAWGMLAMVVGLNLAWVYLMVKLNTWYQKFYDAIQKLDEKMFWSLILYFLVLAGFAILIWVFRQFFTQTLQNRWRRWMTSRLLEQWMGDKSHYLWQLTEKKTDNPDQRIAEDVREFVNNSLELSTGLLNQIVTFFSFIAILWTLSGPITVPLGWGRSFVLPGYMAWVCLLYAVAGTWITHAIGKPLIRLNYRQQLVEANFRFSLVRLRENGESVALCDGEKTEEENLKGTFEWVYSNIKFIIKKQMQLNFFAIGYDQIASVFPLVVAAPRFFAKIIGLGVLIQISNAFGKVKDALSWVVDNYTTLAYWRSVVERLEGFEMEVERTKKMRGDAGSILSYSAGADCIRLVGVELRVPGNSAPIAPPISVEFKKGSRTLISGASGCGKTTLLRAIYGIWPFASGRVIVPENESIMVLPQKQYLPVGTLKSAFTYPRAAAEFTDEEVLKVMSICSLEHLHGRLNEPENWGLILSAGEQQRAAWARLFLMKPVWAFMDESASALDEDVQEKLYRELKDKLPETTLISVAHGQNPGRFHSEVWDFKTGGGLKRV